MRRLGHSLEAALLFPWRVVRSWPHRTAVSGHSMEPTLRDGDWLLVDPRPGQLQAATIVVARDPRSVGRLIVKRVACVASDGSVVLASDHPAHAEDEIGPVERSDIVGRAWLRYWPPRRLRRV